MPLFETVTDLIAQADVVRRRRYGVIEMQHGRLVRVRFRPLPKFATVWQVMLGQWRHAHRDEDRCLLYFNQPWRFPNYLSLKYVISGRGTTWSTVRGALAVLDEIARLKRSDAILCDAANARLSARALARWGWAPHNPSRWHRHFIKRFYGEYPPTHVERFLPRRDQDGHRAPSGEIAACAAQ